MEAEDMTDIVTIPHEAAVKIREHIEGGPGHRRGPWVLVDMERWASVCECGIRTVVSNDVLRETAWASKADEEPPTFGSEEEDRWRRADGGSTSYVRGDTWESTKIRRGF